MGEISEHAELSDVNLMELNLGVIDGYAIKNEVVHELLIPNGVLILA